MERLRVFKGAFSLIAFVILAWPLAPEVRAAPPTTTPATHPAAPSAPPTPPVPTNPAGMIKAAVDQLILEAKEVDNFEKINKNPPVFSRPHPLLKNFTPAMAVDTLNRVMLPMTGNEYRDTYIRWHLMWAIKKIDDADRRPTGARLVELFKQMPAALTVAGRSEGNWEPLDIYQKYQAMVGGQPSANVVIGYPPFQRVIGPPASFKQLPAGAEAKYKQDVEAYTKRVAEAQKLYGGKFKYIRDEGGIAFNHRLRAMSDIMRHYRGELIYEIIQSGDPEIGKLVMSEVARLAKAKNGIAFDLLSYLYLACFDGALNHYDQSALTQMSQILEQGARASEGYVSYGGQQRNFADSAFHLIEMLKDGGGFIEPERIAGPAPRR
jgi:hypothetical protein